MKPTAQEFDRINMEGARRFPGQWTAANEAAAEAATKLDINRHALPNKCLLALVSYYVLHRFRTMFTNDNQSHLDADIATMRGIINSMESQSAIQAQDALRVSRDFLVILQQRKGG